MQTTTHASGDGFWFPKAALHRGHFPLWTWLFPPFWLILVPIYVCWLIALAVIFVFVAFPVNLIRALRAI